MNHFKCYAMTVVLLACTHLGQAMAASSFIVMLYPHDELADTSDEQLRKGYVQPWLDEMRQITQHSIEVIFQRNVAGVTDIAYWQSSPENTLKTFRQTAPAPEYGKALLLTRNGFGPLDGPEAGTVAGFASRLYPYGVASLTTYTALAHELGHLMGATHEAAELRYNPWICETYVYPERHPLRSNCYRYSDANRATIAEHLDRMLSE